jgi:signal transduction histidine kinase/DNA-binding NarL/FixJ family response regulator
MSKGKVLVIDDEYGIRSGVDQILTLEGYEVAEAETGKEALAALDREPFDIALIDYRLPDTDGLTLLQNIRKRNLDIMTCMITAYANIETAIAATRQGIDFFLPKPFSPEDLIGVTETLIRHKLLRKEAEELKKAHEASLLALASEKSQTHSLVTSLRDAVLVVNRTGEVVLANPAMGKLLRKEEDSLLRKPAAEILAAEPFAPIRAALGQATGENTVFEIEMGDQQFMVSLTPFHSERREVLGYIATISDISEVRRLALEKSRFIRTMIHEFRSPMGAVKSILEVALDKSMGDGLEPYLPLLDRAEKRLDGLVELIGNLLSLSKIEAEGKKKVAFEPVDASAVVKEVIELYREKLQARNLRVEVQMEPGIPRIAIPADDLRTLLVNLIGNAVKYNRDGGTVGIQANRLDGKARIDVTDTGLGIQAQNLPHIFDEFFREKRKETRDIEGNGLGLAIVKRLVERSSGKIEVQSTEGVGSTFSIYLPLNPLR